MIILRAHLFSENLLEEIIRLNIPRGDKVIESAGLKYSQKLELVNSFDNLGEAIYSSLRNLNRLRNEFAHDLGKSTSENDVVRIGSSLGKNFTKIRKECGDDTFSSFLSVVDYIIGSLAAHKQYTEDAIVKK